MPPHERRDVLRALEPPQRNGLESDGEVDVERRGVLDGEGPLDVFAGDHGAHVQLPVHVEADARLHAASGDGQRETGTACVQLEDLVVAVLREGREGEDEGVRRAGFQRPEGVEQQEGPLGIEHGGREQQATVGNVLQRHRPRHILPHADVTEAGLVPAAVRDDGELGTHRCAVHLQVEGVGGVVGQPGARLRVNGASARSHKARHLVGSEFARELPRQ